MKYVFKQIDNISGANAITTIEFDTDNLPEVLRHFEMFLRGSGFHPSGTLDFVPDEEYYGQDVEWSAHELYDSMDLPPQAPQGQNAY